MITVSTSKAAGRGEDESGPRLARWAKSLRLEIAATEIVPDDPDLLSERLRHWADTERCEVVLTTGGTGLSPTDLTPEATRAIVDREAPGIAEAMRAASRDHTPHWMLSRGIAGVRGSTLIVNFPGNPPAIDQAGAAIADAVPHALELLRGGGHRHG